MAILAFSYTFRHLKCVGYIINPGRFCAASRRYSGLMDVRRESISACCVVATSVLQEFYKVSHGSGIYNEATKKEIQPVYLSATTKTRNIRNAIDTVSIHPSPLPFRDQTKAAPWPAANVTFCTSIALSNCSSNPSCTAFEIASLIVSALCATLRSIRARVDPRPAEAVGLESA